MWWYFAATIAFSAITRYYSSRAEAQQMETQAQISTVQAQIALQQAQVASEVQLRRGKQEAKFVRRESARRVGGMVVRISGSGQEVSGSPLIAIGEQMRLDELNAARVITNASARAMSERIRGRGQALSFQGRANALAEQAKYIKQAGFLDMIGFGMGQAANIWAMTGGSSQPGQTGPSYQGDFGHPGYSSQFAPGAIANQGGSYPYQG